MENIEIIIEDNGQELVIEQTPSQVITVGEECLPSEIELNIDESDTEIEIIGASPNEVIEIHQETKGEKGDQGKQGPRGERGYRGIQGPQGLRGPQGRIGPRGIPGPVGKTGSPGTPGNPGAPGTVTDEQIISVLDPILGVRLDKPLEEIRGDIDQIPSDIQNKILGLLTGDSDSDFTWFTGDDEFENSFIGSVTQTSAQTDADYSRLRQAHGMIARTEQSMAAYLQQINLNATNLDALGEIVTTLVASTNGNTAAFEEQIRVLTSFTEATAESVSTLSVSMENSLGQISEELSVHTDDIETLTTSLNTLVSTTNNSFAAMQEDITLLTTETEANSSAISTLEASVGDNTASIEELWESTVGGDGIKSHYQLRISAERADGLRAIAGIALGAAIGEDGSAQSEIIMLADQFILANEVDGVLTQPFTFNAVTGTAYLRNALIENASIGSAKFTDWLYSDALDVNDNPVLGLNFRTGAIKSGVSGYKIGKGYYVGPVDPGNPSSAIGFFVGDSAGTHMVFDANGLNIEGPLVATGNILNNAVTNTLTLSGTAQVTGTLEYQGGKVLIGVDVGGTSITQSNAGLLNPPHYIQVYVDGVLTIQQAVATAQYYASGMAGGGTTYIYPSQINRLITLKGLSVKTISALIVSIGVAETVVIQRPITMSVVEYKR